MRAEEMRIDLPLQIVDPAQCVERDRYAAYLHELRQRRRHDAAGRRPDGAGAQLFRLPDGQAGRR